MRKHGRAVFYDSPGASVAHEATQPPPRGTKKKCEKKNPVSVKDQICRFSHELEKPVWKVTANKRQIIHIRFSSTPERLDKNVVFSSSGAKHQGGCERILRGRTGYFTTALLYSFRLWRVCSRQLAFRRVKDHPSGQAQPFVRVGLSILARQIQDECSGNWAGKQH